MAQNYMKFVKYGAGGGALLGTCVSIAVMSDIKRPLLNTEKIVYPIAGFFGGAFMGTTMPIWIIFAPIAYVAGPETAGAVAKVALGSVLLGKGEGIK